MAPVIIRHEHRGIPFNEWLDLFLEYAINLALTQQAQESYEICTSAKDSVVFKSKENAFLIHLTHASAYFPDQLAPIHHLLTRVQPAQWFPVMRSSACRWRGSS